MKAILLTVLGSISAGAGFFVTAYVVATIVDSRRNRRRKQEREAYEAFLPIASERLASRRAKKKHSTIYDEMMDNPELAESLLVDKEPWPDSLRNTAKSTGARDQSTLDTATEFHRDPS